MDAIQIRAVSPLSAVSARVGRRNGFDLRFAQPSVAYSSQFWNTEAPSQFLLPSYGHDSQGRYIVKTTLSAYSSNFIFQRYDAASNTSYLRCVRYTSGILGDFNVFRTPYLTYAGDEIQRDGVVVSRVLRLNLTTLPETFTLNAITSVSYERLFANGESVTYNGRTYSAFGDVYQATATVEPVTFRLIE